MKNFFLKKHDESRVTRLDPVAALEERLKSTETIADPAERLLALGKFSEDCCAAEVNIFLPRFGMIFGTAWLVIAPVTIACGLLISPVAFIPGAAVMFGAILLTETPSSTERKLSALGDRALTERNNLIENSDLHKLVKSPFFEPAAQRFSKLRERFQLSAQKTAFLGQEQAKPLPQPQTPNDGFRF